jgi:hypothetical protein
MNNQNALPHTGPKILLEGGSGTGKTYSARTLIKAGIEVRAVFTEPRWGSLSDLGCKDGLHINYVNPTASTWEALAQKAESLTRLPWEAAAKWADPKKGQYDGFIRLLQALHTYKCVNCGKDFGDATTWDSSKCLWFDGLSGLNQAALQMVTGGAVTRSLPQWGAAMESESQFIKQCVYGTTCWFVLVTHQDKVLDEVNGGMVISPLALGRKVGPELPKDFDEVVQTERVGDKFKWTNIAQGVDLKATYLPLSNDLPPSFQGIYDKWILSQHTQQNSVSTGTE